MERQHSFAPLVNTASRILILGSLPGVESLRRQQYYAHPRNAFWRLLYAVFAREPDEDYLSRCAFLLAHNLALWDVCQSAERSGSADSKIGGVRPNDIAGLLAEYPHIERILLNGRKAESEYRRYFKPLPLAAVYVPSTSPALAALNFDEKLRRWQDALGGLR
jgi:hypoxanthine-DNA glycosylase